MENGVGQFGTYRRRSLRLIGGASGSMLAICQRLQIAKNGESTWLAKSYPLLDGNSMSHSSIKIEVS